MLLLGRKLRASTIAGVYSMSHLYCSLHLIIYKTKVKHILRSWTPARLRTQPVEQTVTFVAQVQCHQCPPGSLLCALQGWLSPELLAAGVTGSDCPPLHSAVTAIVCSMGSCANTAERNRAVSEGQCFFSSWVFGKSLFWTSFLFFFHFYLF